MTGPGVLDADVGWLSDLRRLAGQLGDLRLDLFEGRSGVGRGVGGQGQSLRLDHQVGQPLAREAPRLDHQHARAARLARELHTGFVAVQSPPPGRWH
jgi:hypothetical protein